MAARQATPPFQTTDDVTVESAEVHALRTPVAASRTTDRHTKKLSLSFPILPPLQSQHAVGLRTSSPTRSPFPSPRRMAPIDPPSFSPTAVTQSVSSDVPEPATVTTPEEDSEPDNVLTLVAAQERRVLELREELQKAENELQCLKRQWAMGEARKKNAEVKNHTHKMKRLSGSIPSAGRPDESRDDDRTRTERQLQRRKTLMDRSNSGSRHVSRRSQQRVFSSGRHARTLSLLATSTPNPSRRGRRTSLGDTASTSSEADQSRTSALPVHRSSTLPTADEDVGFGRTYKSLATQKGMNPVPPGADALMRQGQKVAEGLKEGLWNFFEDIRQATVGEEGINGVATQQPRKAVPRKPSTNRNDSKRYAPENENKNGGRERSFWREFGIDTPKKDDLVTRATPAMTAEINRDSTNTSTSVPDLLVDLNDDKDWEPWASPRVDGGSAKVNTIPSPKADQAMPWPELERPRSDNMKLTKSISAMMREWDKDNQGSTEEPPGREG